MLIIETILFVYLAGCIGYNLFFSIAGRLFPRRDISPGGKTPSSRILVLVPAYKEDEVILSVAHSYTVLDYPGHLYDVLVIADSLQPQTLESLRGMQVQVLPVAFDKSTKSKSINAAFQSVESSYDVAIICDADNIPSRDFLRRIDAAYQEGHHAIQANRVAKNLDSTFAILDGANEIIANHVYRKGANAAGLSSSVIGSGMAFHYPLIREVMSRIAAVGGFDKVLQLEVVRRGHSIRFLENALIYDEKVPGADAFRHQRRRWLSSQWIYLREFFIPGWKMLLKGNVNYFNLSVCQNLLLPRMLLLAATAGLAMIYLLAGAWLSLPAFAWWALLGLYAVSLLLPIPALFYRKYMLRALAGLPRAMGIMVGLVFRLRGANETFIHTRHTKTNIDNPLLDAVKK